MKARTLLYSIFAFVALTIVGCEDSYELDSQLTLSSKKDPYLYVSREQFSIVSETVQQNIVVESSGDFEVSCSESWLKASKSDGKIIVSADKFTGENLREATVIVKLLGHPHVRKIKVVQYNSDGLAVDLGLSVKWASMNVGAMAPEDYGDYFMWGNLEPTDPSKYSDFENCRWYDGFKDNSNQLVFKKYNETDGKTVLDLIDDAAHVNWGGNWRMPTKEEVEELKKSCSVQLSTEINGINGCVLTSNLNGKSIFLPYGGTGLDHDAIGRSGEFWTSTFFSEDVANCFWFSINYQSIESGANRIASLNIRPVCP